MPKRGRAKPSPSETRRHEENLILQTTEAIVEAMRRNVVTKAELARRMGRSNAYVTQILSGERNLTLRTIAAAALALDSDPKVILVEKD